MTDEQEALAMVNEVRRSINFKESGWFDPKNKLVDAVALRAVQERKAFAQEVSAAVEAYNTLWHKYTPSRATFMDMLGRFIITQPDPLVEVLEKCSEFNSLNPHNFRELLAKHNGRIVFDD